MWARGGELFTLVHMTLASEVGGLSSRSTRVPPVQRKVWRSYLSSVVLLLTKRIFFSLGHSVNKVKSPFYEGKVDFERREVETSETGTARPWEPGRRKRFRCD